MSDSHEPATYDGCTTRTIYKDDLQGDELQGSTLDPQPTRAPGRNGREHRLDVRGGVIAIGGGRIHRHNGLHCRETTRQVLVADEPEPVPRAHLPRRIRTEPVVAG